MKCEVSQFFFLTGFFGAVGCSPFLAYADVSDTITLICPDEEYGQLGLHDCYAAHVGGRSRRQTVIHSSREKHSAPLNPHTGNILDPTDPNIKFIRQIALEALSAIHYDAACLGPDDLCLPLDSLPALNSNHPNLPVVCAYMVSALPAPVSSRRSGGEKICRRWDDSVVE